MNRNFSQIIMIESTTTKYRWGGKVIFYQGGCERGAKTAGYQKRNRFTYLHYSPTYCALVELV